MILFKVTDIEIFAQLVSERLKAIPMLSLTDVELRDFSATLLGCRDYASAIKDINDRPLIAFDYIEESGVIDLVSRVRSEKVVNLMLEKYVRNGGDLFASLNYFLQSQPIELMPSPSSCKFLEGLGRDVERVKLASSDSGNPLEKITFKAMLVVKKPMSGLISPALTAGDDPSLVLGFWVHDLFSIKSDTSERKVWVAAFKNGEWSYAGSVCGENTILKTGTNGVFAEGCPHKKVLKYLELKYGSFAKMVADLGDNIRVAKIKTLDTPNALSNSAELRDAIYLLMSLFCNETELNQIESNDYLEDSIDRGHLDNGSLAEMLSIPYLKEADILMSGMSSIQGFDIGSYVRHIMGDHIDVIAG